MGMNRRELFKAIGAASLAVGITQCSDGEKDTREYFITRKDYEEHPHTPEAFLHHQIQWLLINKDSSITALAGRTELGQGGKTLLVSAVSQAMKLPMERVEAVLGDTAVTPDNGPTNGSAMTILVVWPYFIACHKIIEKLLDKGAELLGLPKDKILYDDGFIWSKDRRKSIAIGDLHFDDVLMLDIPPETKGNLKGYKDPGIGNILGPDIVTGSLEYVADLYPENCQYGGLMAPEYPFEKEIVNRVKLKAARKLPGVSEVRVFAGIPSVIGSSYSSVQKALKKISIKWQKPARSRKFDAEEEIRSGRRLVEVIKNDGDINKGFLGAKRVFEESYKTHWTTQCPMETDTAIARRNEDDTYTVWVSSQYPHGQRELIAKRLKKQPEEIHVIGMPVGGGFGGKITNPVAKEAGEMVRVVDTPVKVIYTTANQFLQRGKVKEIVIVDFKTAVGPDGTFTARQIDIHQDEGKGAGLVYKCKNLKVNHYHSPVPHIHAVVRGTSYIQGTFANESHVDSIACKLGYDPLEFRLKNVKFAAHKTLLWKAAEMMDYGRKLPADTGIGMALVNHGWEELGAVMSQLHVNRKTGRVTVQKICGAFDIGKVMNYRTCRMGVEGCYMWGIGFALLEHVKADGHSIHTRSMQNYEVPRFEHLPEVDVEFMQVHPHYGGPRGVGEMPMVPVTPSIANAIYNAVGLRLYQTPFTPERIRSGLGEL